MNSKKFYIIAVLGFLLDRVIKYYAIKTPEFFSTFFINENFAWSIPVPNKIIVIIMIFVIVFLIYWSIQKSQPIIWITIAGALSNFIDRVLFDGVIDYITVPWGGVINIADIMIFVGILLFAIKTKNRD